MIAVFVLLFVACCLSTVVCDLNMVDHTGESKLLKKRNPVKKHVSGSTPYVGSIVSAQFMCSVPCEKNWFLQLVKLNYPNSESRSDNGATVLQTLLPPADTVLRQFEVFTAYDSTSRLYTVVASDYPNEGSATFWTYTIANDISAATPVQENVVLTFPTSTSPFPLNYGKLKLTRVLNAGVDGSLIAIFSNGEIHSVDVANAQSKLLTRVFSDSQLLSTSFPQTSWSSYYDGVSRTIKTVTTSSNQALLYTTDMQTLQTTNVAMILPQGMNNVNQFSPQTFFDAHSVTLPDGTTQLLQFSESLYNIGFDFATYVDTTTGQLGGGVDNLMEYEVEFACNSAVYQCDMWRTTTVDPINNLVYFQAHYAPEGMSSDQLNLYVMGFTTSVVDPVPYPYINVVVESMVYGYTGYQFVLVSN
jgi:hypothetical protein